MRWEIMIMPTSDAPITIALPATTDCNASGGQTQCLARSEYGKASAARGGSSKRGRHTGVDHRG